MITACEDDFNTDFGIINVGEETTATISVKFDIETGVDLQSRSMTAEDGDAIQDINSFWMLLYDENGMLKYKFHIKEGDNTALDEAVSNVSYKRADNRLPSESDLEDKSAGYLTFDLRVAQNRYFAYGVANTPEVANLAIGSNRNQLKQMKRVWDKTVLANNSEMFGIFSLGSNRDAVDDTPIPVRADGAQLHCWLRRLASKVTVAFDGSKLYDNVQVYIDTIMLCDIPKQCYLGENNYPGRSLEDLEKWEDPERRYADDYENGVIYQGPINEIQQLKSSDLSHIDPVSMYHVCNGKHKYFGKGEEGDSQEIIDNTHSHTAKSLFFYENLQGPGKSKKQSQDGLVIDYPKPEENDLTSGWKDNKAYGTYVEVRGYYTYESPAGNMSTGWIKYRFMLGQDADTDYNAVRNTHYKLTLVLQGYGNDYDWHIDFKEEVGLYAVSPQYISYLYNKSMYATIKIVGEMDPNYKLKAEILDNTDDADSKERTFWRPWGINGNESFPDPDDHTLPGLSIPIYLTGSVTDGSLDSRADGRETSFLSLKKSSVLKIEHPDYTGENSNKAPEGDALNYLHKYYNEIKHSGERSFNVNEGDNMSDDVDGAYSMQITKRQNGTGVPIERLFRVPLYTRAKELVTKTGFTGNNPFESYPRKQKVKFTAKLKDESGNFVEKSVIIDVIQVRRIVNPKGVWRRGDKKPEDFHVTLLRMPEDNGKTFKSFLSIGKWSAEVLRQSDPIISLSSTTEGSGIGAKPQKGVSRVDGDSECPIDFFINFNGAKGCAIIRVRYHNFTCEHDIFVRVGYDPIQLVEGSTLKWSSYNIHHFEGYKAVHATSPLQEGSMFRRGSRVAILSTNNPVNALQTDVPSSFDVIRPGSRSIVSASWADCLANADEKKSDTNKNYNLVKAWTISNNRERIATIDDYYTLTTTNAENLNFEIQKAYGVVYGDGANTPATATDDAYGYDSETGADSNKGMRGVVLYNKNTCHQIFMPLGKSGHGRRKGMGGWTPSPNEGIPNDAPGTLRYAARSYPWTNAYYSQASANLVKMTPLFYDIYRRPGAIYWCRNFTHPYPKEPVKQQDGSFKPPVMFSASFDINYFTMGFEGYENGSIGSSNDLSNGSKSDACFIRTVFY